MYKLNDVLSAFQDYSIKGKFLYHRNDSLSISCNIPENNNYSGLYFFYDNDTDELLYIGISGRETSEGQIQHRKDGLRGRVVNGKQFGDFRKNTLSIKMKEENIKTLRIEWFVTYGHSEKQIPRKWEIVLLNLYQKEFSRLPRWNKEI